MTRAEEYIVFSVMKKTQQIEFIACVKKSRWNLEDMRYNLSGTPFRNKHNLFYSAYHEFVGNFFSWGDSTQGSMYWAKARDYYINVERDYLP